MALAPRRLVPAATLLLAAALGCERPERAPEPTGVAPEAPEIPAATLPDTLPRGLLLALAQFEVSPEGKVLPQPKAARLDILLRREGDWRVEVLEDPESNVFHKAMVHTPAGGEPGILTLGGSAAALKLWRRGPEGFVAETLWQKDFGGRFSRMRDAEAADLFGTGRPALAIATHDQGVVATLRRDASAEDWQVREIDQEKDTFVHEIEIGDLDGDGVLEVYATPSEPNRLDGTPQSGKVVRYVPAREEGRTVVADLGTRHAKEILVGDVDGDGRDELYVAVEGEVASGGDQRLLHPVEIRRYRAGTAPDAGEVIARIDDRLCRFLTAGDVEGDGRREMVAAAFRSGLWLLRPGETPEASWQVESIDRDSSGFEHAALLADLDGDGRDELYVASDDQGEVRRYVWQDGRFAKQVIHRRAVARSAFTWNLMPVPAALVE